MAGLFHDGTDMPKATEGTTAPVALSRELIERPTIQRGDILVPGTDHMQMPLVVALAERQTKATFTVTNAEGYALTYHDVDVISLRGGVTVFVGPHDVVTWERPA